MRGYPGLVITLLACLTYGCAQTENAKKAEFNTDISYKYPPVSIYAKHASSELQKDCEEFDDKSILHHCSLYEFDLMPVKEALEEADLFQQVLISNDNVDYSLSITTATYNVDDAAELTGAAVSGASLLLIPMQDSKDIKSEFVLSWRGIPIKQYDYTLPLTNTVSLFNMNSTEKENKAFAEALVSHFLKDSQNDNVYSGEFLANALGASDYENDLVLPEQVEDYFLSGKYVYPDPLLGVQARYVHGVLSEFIDVYIYPIKSVEWHDVKNILETETNIVRKELELMEKEGIYNHIEVSENTLLEMTIKEQAMQGLHFSVTFNDREDRGNLSITYLFLMKDKVIKFRTTKQDPRVKFDIQGFVAGLLENTDPPDESTYMAKLRQNVRENTITGEGVE